VVCIQCGKRLKRCSKTGETGGDFTYCYLCRTCTRGLGWVYVGRRGRVFYLQIQKSLLAGRRIADLVRSENPNTDPAIVGGYACLCGE